MNVINLKTISAIVLSLLLAVSTSQSVMAKKAVSKQSVAQATSVNLNTANAKQIAKALKGIGMKKAEAIIAYRTKHGDFKAIEELASVKGIGVATIAKNHNRIALK
ncbi:MAG: helix-hairpin-helix domain-containing protein [Kangiellaceae bacterium]|nr:helix-hairpin-helix domain-containing protein [Kangiellaceae bacterium]